MRLFVSGLLLLISTIMRALVYCTLCTLCLEYSALYICFIFSTLVITSSFLQFFFPTFWKSQWLGWQYLACGPPLYGFYWTTVEGLLRSFLLTTMVQNKNEWLSSSRIALNSRPNSLLFSSHIYWRYPSWRMTFIRYKTFKTNMNSDCSQRQIAYKCVNAFYMPFGVIHAKGNQKLLIAQLRYRNMSIR